MIPKISIIIPTYNSYSLMNNCLKALEQQTYKEFEVIIVDDCSTDNTYENIEQYASKSSLDIKFHKLEQNSGPGVARNVGIANATGEWIAFCDSDDWYEVEFIQQVLKQIDNTSCDIVMIDYYNVSKSGNKIKSGYTKNLENISDQKKFIAYSKPSLCNLIIKKNIMLEVKIPTLYNGEDIAIIPLILSRSKKISVITNALYNYYLRESSTSNRINSSIYKSLLQAFSIIEDELGDAYKEEVEFIGIEVILYSMSLTALKAKVEDKLIKEEVDKFIKKYNKWNNNKYYKDYNKVKKFYVWACSKNMLCINKLFAMLHYLRNKI